MNIKRAAFCVLPLALLGVGEAQAELVTKEIVAEIYFVSDPSSALNGTVVSGDIVSGTYTYETTTPDQNATPEVGYYPHEPNFPLGFDLTAGDQRFVAAETDTLFEIEIDNFTDEHRYRIHNWIMQNLANGAYVDTVRVDLVDPSATAHENDLLQAAAPDLAKYQYNSILIAGSTPDRSDTYTISAHITSIKDAVLSPAITDPVTYAVTAQVAEVYDPEGVLNGDFALGTEITGTYTVELSVADEDPYWEYGSYPQPLVPGLGADLRVGGEVLRSQSEQSQVVVSIEDWPEALGMDRYSIGAPMNHQLASGATVTGANLWLTDASAIALNSDALTAEAPLSQAFTNRDIIIAGTGADGMGWFQVRAEITSISLDDGHVFQVSPPAANYDRYQNFALGLIFDQGVEPELIGGTLNGADITPYLNSTECQPGAPNDQQRVTVVCPYFSGQLKTGTNDLRVTVGVNGRIYTEQTAYEVIGY